MPGSATAPKRKMQKTIKGLVFIFIVLGAVIMFSSLFSRGSFFLIPEEVVALSDATLESDGKGVVEVVSTENLIWTPSGTSDYLSGPHKVALKTGKFFSDSDGFHYFVDVDEESYGDPFFVLGDRHNFSDYSAMVYDVDVTLSEDFPYLLCIRPDFRTESGASAVINSGLVRYADGSFYLFGRNGTLIKDGIDNTFHYTFIVYSDGTILIYCDGKLVTKRPPYTMYKEECAYVGGLRVSLFLANTAPSELVECSVSNITVSAFAPEYDGYIFELLENEDLTLDRCPDSILYKKKK